jgi:hypothetical protein
VDEGLGPRGSVGDMKHAPRPRGWSGLLLAAALFVPVTWTVPRYSCGWHASGFYEAKEPLWLGLADEVVRGSGVGADHFHTGDARFDGEWAFATNQDQGIRGSGTYHYHSGKW